jgi:hypothetical protein
MASRQYPCACARALGRVREWETADAAPIISPCRSSRRADHLAVPIISPVRRGMARVEGMGHLHGGMEYGPPCLKHQSRGARPSDPCLAPEWGMPVNLIRGGVRRPGNQPAPLIDQRESAGLEVLHACSQLERSGLDGI